MRSLMSHVPRRVSILAFSILLSLAGLQTANAQEAENTYIEGGVLWQQASGERRAMSYQVFNLARMLLDRDLRVNRRLRRTRAIIVDLDETILDNSPYEGMLLKRRVNYPTDWTAWINRSEAAAVPGSLEFLNYARSRGVRVFYVTNRKEIEKEGTARNLKKLGFPEVNDQTLLIRTDKASDSKEPRRQSINSKYRIVLLMGDDLNDFASAFEDSKTPELRMAAADRFKAEFGKRFIMLPNAMYGNWELSMYGSPRWSDAEKAEARKKLLKSY
jgi:5'-nucleotidase (lipoprotein e(P4) family)